VRSGNWQAAGKKPRNKRPPFKLRPTGLQPVALLWKNLISAGQAFTLRLWLVLVATAAGASVGLGQTLGSAGLAPALGMVAALLLPMLNLITLQIPNAAVLLFPAWFQASREGAHGIEATGQRLIFMLGQLLAFVVALLPAAAFFIGFFFILRIFLTVSLVIP